MPSKEHYYEERKRLITALIEFAERAAKEGATAEEVQALPAVASRLIELLC